MQKTKVLIADDHQIVIGGIRSVLEELPEFEIIGEAYNGRDAVRLARSLKPDIIIMDISMPDLNGIDATLQLRKKNPEIRVVIFSMYSDKEYVLDLFRAGISAYVLKEDPITELIFALKTARYGGTYFSTMTPSGFLEEIKRKEQMEADKIGFGDLSLREREILQLITEGNSIKDITQKLNLSRKTVEIHRFTLMSKLGAHSVAELTKIAIRKRLITP